jgi:hypothetical protein
MSFVAARIDANAGNGTMATHGDDNGLYVEFEMRPFHLAFRSQEEGRPIYEDRPFITILFPGDKTKKIERWAVLSKDKDYNDTNPADDERFPRQWAAFEKQEAAPSMGLPVTEWPPISKSEAAELKGLNFHTVESLAQASDQAIGFMGGLALREKARAWVESAKGHAAETKAAAENVQLREMMKVMQEQIDALKAGQQEETRRGPGRPPKTHD